MIVDIVFVVLVIILIYAIYRIKFKNYSAKIAATRINQVPVTDNNNAQRPIQQPARPRWAQAQAQARQQPQVEDSQSDGEVQTQNMTLADRKKQLRKQQKAKQKKQQKQALEHFLDQEKKKRQKQDQEEEQKQRIQAEKKAKQEHYFKMLAEQEEKKKKAQYQKWKGLFKVDTEGKAKDSAEVQQQKKQQLSKNILLTLTKNKLSLLDDLAHKFKLSTTQLIQKIKQLETKGEVKGIFDERGKYLGIEQKQWDAVRNYIDARGRLKKIDIMQECAKIIKIPDSVDVDQEMIKLIENQNQTAVN